MEWNTEPPAVCGETNPRDFNLHARYNKAKLIKQLRNTYRCDALLVATPCPWKAVR